MTKAKTIKVAALPLLALAVLFGAGVYGVTKISADEAGGSPSIIQKLAETFNLDETEVQGVFEAQREERMQEKQAHFEEHLDQLVADGELTEEQKQAIIDKKAEMEETMTAMRENMQTWAEENGIDFPIFGHGMRGGFGKGGFMRGMGHGPEAPTE